MNMRVIWIAAAAAALAVSACSVENMKPAVLRYIWSTQEVATIGSMRLKEAGQQPAEASKAFEQRPDAAPFGHALFNDTRLNKNGLVACVSCHDAKNQF